jgi:hypothetical protein
MRNVIAKTSSRSKNATAKKKAALRSNYYADPDLAQAFAALAAVEKEVTSSKKAAIKFLTKAGFLDKSGHLAARYRR